MNNQLLVLEVKQVGNEKQHVDHKDGQVLKTHQRNCNESTLTVIKHIKWGLATICKE